MEKGLVIKCVGKSYRVRKDDGTVISCMIRGKLRLKGIKTTNPVTVGDWVDFDIVDTGEIGLIKGIMPRKNYIIRKSTNLSRQHHVIASNIDRTYLIVTLSMPRTSTSFIDRFLVSAEAYRIPVTLVFNKLDLYDQQTVEELASLQIMYEAIGYECLLTSATKNINIDLLKDKLAGKINLLSGHSGVGKSTLINLISPGLNLKVDVISVANKTGKHTTTFSEMFELQAGGFIIDTPGIRGFGLTDMYREEIYHFFPEMFKVAKDCQYYNCTHIHEPNCAVKAAVENGDIGFSRYNSYLSMMDGDEKHRSDIYG